MAIQSKICVVLWLNVKVVSGQHPFTCIYQTVSYRFCLWWFCVNVSLLGPGSFDESLEEPFSLPASPFSSYKWVGPSWPARSLSAVVLYLVAPWNWMNICLLKATCLKDGELSHHVDNSYIFIFFILWSFFVGNEAEMVILKSEHTSSTGNSNKTNIILDSPKPQIKSKWCFVLQGENYCCSGEPCRPNTNLNSDITLFFSHRFSMPPLPNRASWYLKCHQKTL